MSLKAGDPVHIGEDGLAHLPTAERPANARVEAVEALPCPHGRRMFQQPDDAHATRCLDCGCYADPRVGEYVIEGSGERNGQRPPWHEPGFDDAADEPTETGPDPYT